MKSCFPVTIFKATNKANGKTYIGFDSNWPKRLKTHRYKFNKNHTKFYDAIKKYGWHNFEWAVIYQSKDYIHCLNIMEPYFIEEYDSFNSGYNMTVGGEAPMMKRKHSEESKQKMSDSKKKSGFLKEHINVLSQMKKKPIICKEDNLIFNSISEACNYYNISNFSMSNHLKGKSKQLKIKKSFKYV